MIEADVVVAVLTYRRPDDLEVVVPLLLEQVRGVPDDAVVLVVDNDPDGGARGTVEGFGAPDLHYRHEPRPGIAAARNRALDEAAGTDVLVFVDDDERPCADWLALMLDLHRSTGAAAVVGSVVSEYEHEPDPWIVAGRFFDRRRLATGTEVDVAATNNLLLDLAQVADLRFDEAFGLTGGSDTLFTRALVAREGATMIWCDEAVVVDRVPTGRLSRRWVLQKALRSGNSWSRTSLVLARGDRTRLRLTLSGRGVVRLLGGLARAGLGTLLRSQGQQARGARTAARGAGMALGAWGWTYTEYRRRPSASRRASGRTPSIARRLVRRLRKRAKRSWSHVLVTRHAWGVRFGRRPLVGETPVVVSLTTHGDRTDGVAATIESIGRGSVRPGRLVLWLDDPRRFDDLPASLRRLQRRGLDVRLTENRGPHTKYYPYVDERPVHEHPLVTADDDILYPRRWLAGLLEAHRAHPDVVSCYRASVVALRGDRIAPYDAWPRCTDTRASVTRFATGVSGVLYPAAMLQALRERGDAFKRTTPRADDLWLHWVALRAGIPVRQVAARARHFPFAPGTQEAGLMVDNVGQGGNDRAVERVYDASDVEALRRAGAPEA